MSFKRFLVATDNHGKLVCPKATKKLLTFSEAWKPHYRIHLGDLWDFSPLRGGASQEDQADGIAEDYWEGLKFLDAFKPTHLTLGNHDDRIWQLARNSHNGTIRERCGDLVAQSEKHFDKAKIQWIGYKIGSFLQLPEGGPKLIHGFRSSIVSPAKLHYSDWGSCLHGHVHKPDEYTATHADGGAAFSVGCMANMDLMTYADRQPSKMGWRNGFLYGYINTKTGKWHAWNVKKEGQDWISPQGPL